MTALAHDPKKLRAARINAGVNLSSLARTADVSKAQLSDMEAGRKGTTAETLGKIAAALSVQPSDLLPD